MMRRLKLYLQKDVHFTLHIFGTQILLLKKPAWWPFVCTPHKIYIAITSSISVQYCVSSQFLFDIKTLYL